MNGDSDPELHNGLLTSDPEINPEAFNDDVGIHFLPVFSGRSLINSNEKVADDRSEDLKPKCEE